jgi:hypothetical protein
MILSMRFQNEGVIYPWFLTPLDQTQFNDLKNKITNNKLEKGIDAPLFPSVIGKTYQHRWK